MMFSVETNIDTDTRYIMNKRVRSNKNIVTTITSLFSKGVKNMLRPEFFYFLVLGKFLGKPSVGGGNKNKNKIQKFPESE